MKKNLLCSVDLPKPTVRIFNDLQYDAVFVPKCRFLSPAVASHPDILFSVIGERQILTDYNYLKENEAFFQTLAEKGVEITACKQRLSEKYPCDVLFDAIKTDRLLVGNLKYTAPELFVGSAKAVNVKQGYALCSTLLMENAAVCADKGICSVLSENGYNVLQITPGDILLEGCDYGFIGGASAVLEDIKTVVFFGNVRAHPDGEKIISFCRKNGYAVCFDESLPLTDYGSVKII